MFSYRRCWRHPIYSIAVVGGCGRSEPERLEYPARIPGSSRQHVARRSRSSEWQGPRGEELWWSNDHFQYNAQCLVSRRPALSAWTSYFSLSATLSLTRTGSQHHASIIRLRRARTSLTALCAARIPQRDASGRPPEFDGEMPTGFQIRPIPGKDMHHAPIPEANYGGSFRKMPSRTWRQKGRSGFGMRK